MSRRIAYDAPVTKTLIEQDDSLAPVCVLQFEFPPMNCAIGHLEGDVEPKLFTQKLRHILPVALMIPVVEDPIRHTVFLQRLYNHIDFDCVAGLQLCGKSLAGPKEQKHGNRKSDVEGKSVSVSVALWWHRPTKKK